MKRILVRPEALQQLAGEFRQAARSLRDLTGRAAGSLARLDWEVRQQAAVDAQMTRAGSVGSLLVDQAEEMASLLLWKAELFRSTDGAPLPEGAAVAERWEAIGSPVPTPVEAQPADLFWAGVGAVPVVVVGGVKQFGPGFAQWADRYNARLQEHWTRKGTDHAGTVGTEQLMATYRLTPEKVERIWAFSQEHDVDPRVMLAILQQEGTGSFNTNPENSHAYGGGHGPQPDFERDLTGSLETVVLSKLRLYPHAVKAGFPGTWVEWVNWWTPMDNPWKQGKSGVYAADIHWHIGVERSYRAIAGALGSEQENPVQAYADFMNQHSERFQPRHIQGEFEIRPGLPPGTKEEDRPSLARWTTGGFEAFKAPDQYYWHLVVKR